MIDVVVMQLLTNSRLASFRRCQRLHHYQYELLRRPLAKEDALRFGTLWHVGLEAWWNHFALNGNGDQALSDGISAMRHHASEATDDGQIDDWELARAEVLLQGYHTRWAEDMRAWTVIGAEQEFCMPLTNPDTGRTSVTFALGGKMDAVVRLPDATAWIVEHKTSSGDIGPASDYWLRLRIDPQVSTYYDGATSLGHEVTGCLYDVVRRPMLRPLQATPEADRQYTQGKKCKACAGELCPTCKGSGWLEAPRLYAKQRAEDETPVEFRARLLADITEHPDDYFQRGKLVRLEEEMKEHRRDTWMTARHLRDSQLANSHPRNPSSCSLYGRTCQYFDVCTGAASIDDPGRFRDAQQHEELSPALRSPREMGKVDNHDPDDPRNW